jgi:serine/threonine-protein kinase
VLFQNPAAGTKVKKGRRIYVSACIGDRIVTMPRLLDLNLSNTRHALRSFDLVLGNMDLEYISEFEDTIVIFQSVPEGAEVNIGTPIDIVCKVKPLGKTTVPGLVGVSLMEAQDKIKKANLILGEIVYQEAPQLLPLTVIQQEPEADLVTVTGDTVSLIVSKLPQTNDVEPSNSSID